jgi:hypothetical protein
MSIRRKLNMAYLSGSIAIAGAFGLMAESWWLFAIVLVALLAFRCYERIVQPNKQWPWADSQAHSEREEAVMGARNKLNASYCNGALLFAAIAGVITGSWLVFGLAAAVLLTGGVIAGDIRPRPRQW